LTAVSEKLPILQGAVTHSRR